jgi:hypothetical protein
MKQIIFISIFALFFGVSVFAQAEKSPCPKIEVGSSEIERSGEPIYFTAHVGEDTTISKFEYKWTITAGTIVAGQADSTITVDTTGLQDISLTATVEIKGLPENCASTFSESYSVNIFGDPRMFDEYGKLSDNKVKERIKNLYVELGNNPNFQGYIINYGTADEIAARENQIRKAVSLLKYDASRIRIIRGGTNPDGTGVLTKIRIFPSGSDSQP